MMIFDQNSQTTILDNILTPIVTEYMWALDMQLEDFVLAPLEHLEETTSPSIELMINGFRFVLPSAWHILVCDEDTMQLDVVEVSAAVGKEFRALIYGPNMSMPTTSPIRTTDYHPNYVNVGPLLAKHQMLCHPISPTSWVNVAPGDSYNKFLKGKAAGDLM